MLCNMATNNKSRFLNISNHHGQNFLWLDGLWQDRIHNKPDFSEMPLEIHSAILHISMHNKIILINLTFMFCLANLKKNHKDKV